MVLIQMVKLSAGEGTSTGTSSADRIEGMIKNAVYGIITAKACGIKNPTVGILNVDGARQCEMALKELKENGYEFEWAVSGRADGGPFDTDGEVGAVFVGAVAHGVLVSVPIQSNDLGIFHVYPSLSVVCERPFTLQDAKRRRF